MSCINGRELWPILHDVKKKNHNKFLDQHNKVPVTSVETENFVTYTLLNGRLGKRTVL